VNVSTNLILDPLHYAINLVGEESSEIALQVNKILRFGLSSAHPGKTESNLAILQGEITDLIAVIQVLNFELVKREHPPINLDDKAAIERKFEKVGYFAMHSIDTGSLHRSIA
jgi:hypothetical protein